MSTTPFRKGEPFSIRLSRSTDEFVAAEARRTRRSKSAIVEMLTEEAARMRRFPGVGFRGPDGRRRAWVIGTGLDVWQIVEAYRDAGSSIEQLVEETELGEPAVRLAAAYADSFPEEIEELLADNRPSLGTFRTLYPLIEVVEVTSED